MTGPAMGRAVRHWLRSTGLPTSRIPSRTVPEKGVTNAALGTTAARNATAANRIFRKNASQALSNNNALTSAKALTLPLYLNNASESFVYVNTVREECDVRH